MLLEMLKEDGRLSLTRVLPTIGYVTFIIVSLYLAFTGEAWSHYSEFTLATGGSVAVQLGNKWVNSKYNTPPERAGKL